MQEKIRKWAGNHARTASVPALLIVLIAAGTARAESPEHRGRVLIIRGAFTVFSLGMDALGEKLEQKGFDVDVSWAATYSLLVSDIREETQRSCERRPIIVIGHSKGGELAGKAARKLQEHRIPVDLVIVIDAVHRMTVPGNVKRCVNLYHTNPLGLLHGQIVRRESCRTQLSNVNVLHLPQEEGADAINHFNIDASDWIHKLVIREIEATVAPRQTARGGMVRMADDEGLRRLLENSSP
jgi:hypothetical protein